MSLAGKRKEPEPSSSPFPPEIWSAILERVDARSLASARLVCREWREIATPLVRAARVRECLIEPIATLRGCGRVAIRSVALWKGMFVTTPGYGDSFYLWSASGTLICTVNCATPGRPYGWQDRLRGAFGLGDALVVLETRLHRGGIQIWKEPRPVGPTLRSRRYKIDRVRTLERDDATIELAAPWDDRLVVAFVENADEFDMWHNPVRSGVIESWDETGATLSRMLGHERPILNVAALGDKLASASMDSAVRIWDKAGACVSILRPNEGGPPLYEMPVRALHILAWGERLAVSYTNNLVRVWSDATEFFDLPSGVRNGCIYVWEGTLLTKEGTNLMRARDESGGERMLALDVYSISISTHGLLVTPSDRGVMVWGVPE